MKKKIVYISIFCGSVLFTLFFMYQAFFRVPPPSVMNMSLLRVEGTIFLALYWLSITSYFIFRKRIRHIVIHVAIPLLSALLLFIAGDLYFVKAFHHTFPLHYIYYFIFGFFSIPIFAWLVNLLVSYIVGRKSAQSGPLCHQISAMKKKSVYISLFCGSVLFILVFPCQAFFRVYGSVMNMNPVYGDGVLFLVLYWLTIFSYFLFCKKIHNIVIYVVIPLLPALLLYILGNISYGFLPHDNILNTLTGSLYIYLISGWFSVGLFAWPMDLLVSYMVRRKSTHPGPVCQ